MFNIANASECFRAVDVCLVRQTLFMCSGGLTSLFTLLSKKNKKNYRYTQRLKNDRTIKMNCDTSEGLIVLSISNINTFNML